MVERVDHDMFETVVIATDGGKSAERAVDAALDLSERFDAGLHALTVIENSGGNENDNSENDNSESDDMGPDHRGKRAIDDLAARIDSDVHTVIKEGDPATVICSYAEKVDADVVVTGTRGRDNPHGFHLGSVAEAVVHDCPVPVLTVRQLQPNVEQPSDNETSDAQTTDGNQEAL
jgi:nucleotide-binding universal stress UspA family protein